MSEKLCTKCGKSHDEDTKWCAECKTYAREYMRKLSAEHPERVHHGDWKKRKGYQREYRTARLAAGACPRCLKFFDEPHEFKMCEACRKHVRGYINKPEIREKLRKKSSEWDKENPERCRIKSHNRRARKKGNGGTLLPNTKEILFEQQDGLCYLCGELLFARFDDPLSIDHIIPISRGGRNDLSNVRLAHLSCNDKKFTKTYEEFLGEMIR